MFKRIAFYIIWPLIGIGLSVATYAFVEQKDKDPEAEIREITVAAPTEPVPEIPAEPIEIAAVEVKPAPSTAKPKVAAPPPAPKVASEQVVVAPTPEPEPEPAPAPEPEPSPPPVVEEVNRVEYTGIASWYRNGGGLTTASRDFPKGTRLRVEAIASGKTVEVTVNDYGPSASGGRALDLELSAFEMLAPAGAGVIWVKYYKI